VAGNDRPGGDWAEYWRCDQGAGPIEAMHAHFRSHVYHRHSHETYSFGVTDDGAQAFTCRGARHVSTANMVMLFNPDDPHDGHAATGPGFTYRMIHIAPAQVEQFLADAGASGLPLFPTPVVDDPALAQTLRLLHAVLTTPALGLPDPAASHGPPSPLPPHGPASPLPPHGPVAPLAPHQQHGPSSTLVPLQQFEYLTSTLRLLARHATSATVVSSGGPAVATAPAAALIARRVRDRLHDGYADLLTADDLATAAGCSRYAATRAFAAVYGLAPSDYQRQLRLRAARALLIGGTSAAEAAASAGFADQAHLTRWFRRYYGVTPGVYRQAGGRR
jgi:AraC-like DNA-binding protein